MATFQSHRPTGRVAGHLQRVGHAALDGAGAVAAGDTKGVEAVIDDVSRFIEIAATTNFRKQIPGES